LGLFRANNGVSLPGRRNAFNASDISAVLRSFRLGW
jgi:hypothetical protein